MDSSADSPPSLKARTHSVSTGRWARGGKGHLGRVPPPRAAQPWSRNPGIPRSPSAGSQGRSHALPRRRGPARRGGAQPGLESAGAAAERRADGAELGAAAALLRGPRAERAAGVPRGLEQQPAAAGEERAAAPHQPRRGAGRRHPPAHIAPLWHRRYPNRRRLVAVWCTPSPAPGAAGPSDAISCCFCRQSPDAAAGCAQRPPGCVSPRGAAQGAAVPGRAGK